MNYIIQKDCETPAYLQLYRLIRDDIIRGVYPWGNRLPSRRTAAAETGVSTVTVEHAYDLLCEEGYIEARERSGYFVSFRVEDGFLSPADGESVSHSHGLHSAALSPHRADGIHSAAPALSPAPPRNTASAFPAVPAGNTASAFPAAPSGDTAPEFPFSVLTKTMRRVMNDFGETILDRSPGQGCLYLRRAISQYLAQSRGIFADPAQIVIGSGSEYLYSLIVELLGRDRTYGIESPSYKKIEQVYQACNVRYEMLPLGKDGIESAALWKSGADILHISPYRSYPSGVTASASKRHEYIRWAGTGDRYLVEDDFESEFSVSRKPEETLFTHTDRENVIYMNTFSQTVSPSLRTGYMVLPERLSPLFEKKLGFYSCTVPTFIQYVLAELIRGGDFERHINRVRRQKRRECR